MVRLLILVHLLQNKRRQHLTARACCLGCRQHRTEPNRLITAVLLRFHRCAAVLSPSQQETAAHHGSPCNKPSQVREAHSVCTAKRGIPVPPRVGMQLPTSPNLQTQGKAVNHLPACSDGCEDVPNKINQALATQREVYLQVHG